MKNGTTNKRKLKAGDYLTDPAGWWLFPPGLLDKVGDEPKPQTEPLACYCFGPPVDDCPTHGGES